MWVDGSRRYPNAGAYVGMDVLMKGVFHRLATERDGYRPRCIPTSPMATALLHLVSTLEPTKGPGNQPMVAAFAHLHEMKNGKIIRMQQYVDTAMVRKALS